MNGYPYITIDLNKIEHNAHAIVSLCRKSGIEVSGVTKVVCGHPQVANAMLRGGVGSLADSRLENIQRLKNAGINTSFMLLRIPPLSAATKVVELTDVSLNSELSVLTALSNAAQQRHRTHEVIIMVDLGDLREGILPDEVLPFIAQAVKLQGIRLKGLGTNLACFNGVEPSMDNMLQLVELAKAVETRFNIKLDTLSAVNSSGLEMIATGQLPKAINHGRIGEAILLGRETLHRRPWPGTFQDAFILHGEVLEQKHKPSAPIGKRSEDAFGEKRGGHTGEQPEIEDQGMRDRLLVNVGREDIDIHGTEPWDKRLTILGATSGYLVIDATDSKRAYSVGDEISLSLNYGSLLTAMTSEYVKKRVIGGDQK